MASSRVERREKNDENISTESVLPPLRDRGCEGSVMLMRIPLMFVY